MSGLQLHPALLACLMGVLAACVATDLRWRRIPNLVTGPAMVAGAALNCALHGAAGLLAALAGIALGLVILTPPFALGGLGAGDVKMMGAAGAFLGPKLLAISLAAGLVLGGVFAVVSTFRRGRLGETLRRTWSMVVGVVVTQSIAPLRVPAVLPERILLPYSVPLALGTVGAVGWTLIARS
jgi:prepilin peptidase CpaA